MTSQPETPTKTKSAPPFIEKPEVEPIKNDGFTTPKDQVVLDGLRPISPIEKKHSAHRKRKHSDSPNRVPRHGTVRSALSVNLRELKLSQGDKLRRTKRLRDIRLSLAEFYPIGQADSSLSD